MRTAYSAIFYLLIPLILLRLLWRSLKAPDYRLRWRERLAYYSKNYPQQVIWFHAVSVGETEALCPLIQRFQQQHSQAKLLITTTTPTGSARVQAVLGETVVHVYLPYDTPAIVARFMRTFKPILAVIMETELWPNLFAYCGTNGIPLYVINARLSERSARGYQKIPALIQPMLAKVKLIAAQTQDDAERFIAIGARPEQVATIGNMKFDLEIAQTIMIAGTQLKSSIFKGRFVWLVASTHKGEEQIFSRIFKALKPTIPELLLVIVPRHPERFAEVQSLCRQENLNIVTRTSKQACTENIDVYLADTMGELKMLYATADIAFVGGSMVPVGGHNILEAAAVGVPVLFGPYMANFKDIANKVLAERAAIQCHGPDEIINTIQMLYSCSSYRSQLIANGKAFVAKNRGTIAKLCDFLSKEIS